MKTILGHNITLLRKRKGLTLQGLGDKAGVSKGHIHDLEKGRVDNPSVYLARKISRALRVSTDRLIDKPL